MGVYIAQPNHGAVARPSPDAKDLLELAAKYRALLALRERKDRGDDAAARSSLRKLASEHPGCLRELDTLGPPEIRRRAEAAAAAADGGPREPWMSWILTYHRVLGAALWIKTLLEKGRSLDEERLSALLAQARQLTGLPLEPAFVRAVETPPQRRIALLVLGVVAELHDSTPRAIATTLFPARRPSPYTLS